MKPGLHQRANSPILPADAAGETKKSTLNNHIIMRTQKQTAVGPGLGLILLAALVGVPLLEIALFITVGGWIGLAPTLALIVLTAVIGAWMLRLQGLSVLMSAQRQLAAGSLPVAQVFEGLCLVIAGALLLLPGFFTDAVGALLLVPAVRRALYRQVRQRLDPHVAEVRGRARPAPGPMGPSHGPTIETEYEEIVDQAQSMGRRDKKDDQDLPPPQGHWGRRP